MKQLFFILIILFVILINMAGFPQTNPFTGGRFKCGECIKQKPVITDWKTTDTINYCSDCNSEWVYSEWEVIIDYVFTTEYCPCCCPKAYKKQQRRINQQGVIQERWEITMWEYIEPELLEFDKLMKEIIDRYRYSDTLYIQEGGGNFFLSTEGNWIVIDTINVDTPL